MQGPLWLIGSVIIQNDLCMLYAIMLCTELDIIFHLFDCINCGGTYCSAGEMAGKKGQCGAPISVDNTGKKRERWQCIWLDTGTSLFSLPVSQ